MNGLGNESTSDSLPGNSGMPPANIQSDVVGENTEIETDASNADVTDEGVADMRTTQRLSTTTAGSEVFNHFEEHGRTYHAYKPGKYLLPNDEKEQDRLDLQHHLWLLTLGNERLYLAPIAEQLRTVGGGKVLDMCTGTGIWAIDFADQHPATEVIGIDLSPIQPKHVPPTLKFEIDDLEEPWIFNEKFTFIHGRMLFSCFSNPVGVIGQGFRNLQPGGFLEIQDALLWFRCDERSLEGTAMEMWEKKLHDAAWRCGKDWACPTKYKQYMEDAGFIGVKEVHYRWPINPWPTDQHEKEKGKWSLQNLLLGLESISMALMTRYLGMSEHEVREVIKRMEKEIKNRKIHAYIPISVVYGQKPK
ncbi:Secondary metabolism regulator laeA [Lachnellula suecica]|uniref:Secondary metabolism regulator laeA n=1 Tax=Lachnellula suecica TaxID=602035 RepID=A0A8T9CDH2_9HELO|nr:Secondary metabolism regulator laeA [Lachnellula suecica]